MAAHAESLEHRALTCWLQYKQHRSEDALEMAIRLMEESSRNTLQSDENASRRLRSLASFYAARAEAKPALFVADIHTSIDCSKRALRIFRPGEPDPALLVSQLSRRLFRLYEKTDDGAHLNEAINFGRQAMQAATNGSPLRLECLSDMSQFLHQAQIRALREMCHEDELKSKDCLAEAVQVERVLVEELPPEDPSKPARLLVLISDLIDLSEATDDQLVLDEAKTRARQAIRDAPCEEGVDLAYYTTLGNCLLIQHYRSNEPSVLEEGIKCLRMALSLHGTAGKPGLMEAQSTLSNLLGSRYEVTGRIADLEEAIRLSRKVVKEVRDSEHEEAQLAIHLHNLSVRLLRRFEKTREGDNIAEAIVLANEAVSRTPRGSPDLAGRMAHVGHVWLLSFLMTGRVSQAETSVAMSRCATFAARKGSTARPMALSALGSALYALYERTGNVSAFKEAVKVSTQAVELTRNRDPNWIGRINNLANILRSEYLRTGISDHLSKALAYAKESYEASSNSDPDCSQAYSTYSGMLTMWYEKTHDPDVLEDAIRLLETAIQTDSQEDINKVNMYSNLASLPKARFADTQDPRDQKLAAENFHKAWSCQGAIPFSRIYAGAECLKIYGQQRQFAAAARLGKNLVDSMPAVNKDLVERNDQQFVAVTFAGIAADLCSCLLELGQAEEALKYLERSRAVIISQLMDRRSDQSALREQYPELYGQYEFLRRELNSAMIGFADDFVSRVGLLDRRQRAAKAFQCCIDKIRLLPGQKGFLLELTTPQILECARGGTIVFINITKIRSDAILVHSGGIKAVHLPLLVHSKVEEWLSTKWHVRKLRAEMNTKYLKFLAWLWEACVKFILDQIHGIGGEKSPSMLRIWWIGSGLAGSLPFHAAGDHTTGSAKNALNGIVSSYVASIKALSHAINRSKQMEKILRGHLLIVSMPTTPSKTTQGTLESRLGDLPFLIDGIKAIEKSNKLNLPVEHLTLESADAVTDRLPTCQIAHFACHGVSNSTDPSQSCLVLQKGEGSYTERDLLTVQRVSGLDLPNAWLAHLSACSTAQNKSEKLSEEVIHVASGFQVAGFPHVIACLWPAPHDVCVKITKSFYQQLLRPYADGDKLVQRDVALILREVVMQVRDEDPGMPLTWAQFVHYGL